MFDMIDLIQAMTLLTNFGELREPFITNTHQKVHYSITRE